MEFTRNEKRAIVQSIGLAANEIQLQRITPLLIRNLEISSPREMEELWEIQMSSIEMMQNLKFEYSPEKKRIFESLMNAVI